MRRWVLVLVAVLVAAVIVWRALRHAPEFHAPASVAALAAQIDEVVPAALREQHVPGAQVAVVADGEVRWSGAYGVTDVDSRRPVTKDTVFQIASVSKVVTAFTAVRLARVGRVDLDAPVRYWRAPTSRYDVAGVTLRRLLGHTAGTNVPGYLGLHETERMPTTAAAAADVHLERAPGSEWAYSGGGYTIAELELERRFRRPLSEVMAETTFQPEGMTHSGAECTTAPVVLGNTARGHDSDGRPLQRYRFAETAAAGLCSTAVDLGRLLAAVMTRPEGERMMTPQPATDGGFGLGLHLERLGDGTRMVWHDGANRGWQSHIAGFPERGWGIAVVTNGDAGGRVIDAVLQLLVRAP